MVMIPSITANIVSRTNLKMHQNYYNMPWEYDADVRGDVSRNHAPWTDTLSDSYFSLMEVLCW